MGRFSIWVGPNWKVEIPKMVLKHKRLVQNLLVTRGAKGGDNSCPSAISTWNIISTKGGLWQQQKQSKVTGAMAFINKRKYAIYFAIWSSNEIRECIFSK